ncbi:MAG TPA: class I SAM-dependent methyltransferase [Terriglobia bacterium]|nr:class I SAM-dependent methyltransferase [Terriglobia bacterium]
MKRLTDVAYWDEGWWKQKRPERLRLYRDVDYETVRLLESAVCAASKVDVARERPRVLELGAGASRVLPYLARRFGYEVYGSDFSWSGCRLLASNLGLVGVKGNVVCEDLFQSALAGEEFDVVYSSGLIEHFDDTRAVIDEHLRLVRPGGCLALIVPNFQGIQGRIWKRLAPALWARHRVFGPEELRASLEALGLEQIRAGHLGSFFIHIGRGAEWSAVNAWPLGLGLVAHGAVRIANGCVSLAFRLSPWRPHSLALSPAFFAIGMKPLAVETEPAVVESRPAA